ncbi:unnamed protein product [Dibothriocephalus latus]|uniref:Uncharacterized protein n=1 Tax=Dibothriocephalus latus TaxID=60516 RepID=A0A3P6T7L9_DIBLA|nr:unnamed protein product [Dibothriocephalus latus]
MRSAALRHLVLPLALLVFTAKTHAVGICDWDQRTFTKEMGQTTFRTVVSWYYSGGYIGHNEFIYNRKRLGCFIGTKPFSCSNVHAGNVMLTDIIVPWLKNVDSIYIKSSYPMTIHRIEDYVQDKTDKEVETEGKNLIHTQVVKASKMGVEFFYCYLDAATPRLAMTYNVDWRNSVEKTTERILSEEVIDMTKANDETNATSPSVTPLPESEEIPTEGMPTEGVINVTKMYDDTNSTSSLIESLPDSMEIQTDAVPYEEVNDVTKPNEDTNATSSLVDFLPDTVEILTEGMQTEELIDVTKPNDDTNSISSSVSPLPDSVEKSTEGMPTDDVIDVTKPNDDTKASYSLVAHLTDSAEISTEGMPTEEVIDGTKKNDDTKASYSLVAPLPDSVEISAEGMPTEEVIYVAKPNEDTNSTSSLIDSLLGSEVWSLREMSKFNMGLYLVNTGAKDLMSMHLGTGMVVFATVAAHY